MAERAGMIEREDVTAKEDITEKEEIQKLIKEKMAITTQKRYYISD